VLFAPVAAFAGRITLAWNPSPDVVTGYRVYYGTSPNPRSTGTAVTLGNQTNATILHLTTGVRYYFVVTAYSAGGESASSNEVDGLAVADPSNQPPSVTLTAPANGTTYVAPATITLTANASDPDGSVARVDFYQGGTVVGTDAAAPYSATWSNVPAGTYSLTAVATDDSGATTTSTASTVTVNASAGLPSGWTAADVGNPSLAGRTTFANVTFSIAAGGADIWDTADQFHYAHRTESGDVDIVARVATLGQTNAWSKAGVMIRASLGAGAAHVSMFTTPFNGMAFQRRPTTGAMSATTPGTFSVAPRWVKLEKRGATITGYESADGTTWTQVGAETVTMPATFYVGLAVTSHDTAASVDATFDNVTVQSPGASQPFTDDPLIVGVHVMRVVHISELRTRIDVLRSGLGLPSMPWTSVLAGSTIIRTSHIAELRTALNAVYAAMNRPVPVYTDDPLVAGTRIKAAHITELRAAIRALP
jgi:hypothetical protein